MRYLSIKNHKQHQHYKDRRPPWIKLHVAILDDYAFSCLQDASKAHLLLLGVLASKMDNKIPYDADFLSRKLGTSEAVDVEVLVAYGFVEVSEDDASAPLARRKQVALVETETETEREAETNSSPPTAPRGVFPARAAARPPEYSAAFEAAWDLFPTRSGSSSKKDAYSAWRARLRSGVSAELLHSGVARYKAYCEAKGIVGTEYVKQCSSFFGKGEHYANPWDAPAAKPKTIMVIKDGWYTDVLV